MSDHSDALMGATHQTMAVVGGDQTDVLYDQVAVDGFSQVTTLYGDAGDDTLLGFAGDDRLEAALGTDCVSGDDGNDELDGGTDDDELWGGAGNATLRGGAGRHADRLATNDTCTDGQGIISAASSSNSTPFAETAS
jgi:Ca2+-binding RTX toxin-like protein